MKNVTTNLLNRYQSKKVNAKKWSNRWNAKFIKQFTQIPELLLMFNLLNPANHKTIIKFILESQENTKILFNPEIIKVNDLNGSSKLFNNMRFFPVFTIFNKTFEEGKSIEDTGIRISFLAFAECCKFVSISVEFINVINPKNISEQTMEVTKATMQFCEKEDDLEKIVKLYLKESANVGKSPSKEVINSILNEMQTIMDHPDEKPAQIILFEVKEKFEKIKANLTIPISKAITRDQLVSSVHDKLFNKKS